MPRIIALGCRSVALMLFAPILMWGNAALAQAPSAPFVSWITGLPSSQYTVTPGTVVNFSCSTTTSNVYLMYLGSCFGNNSATPYILINVPPPPSPTGYGLPGYITLNFGNPAPPATPIGYDFYELADNEAVVTIITLPPQAAFYSFQGYMFERQDLTNYSGTAPTVPLSGSCTPFMSYTTGGHLHRLSDDCKYQEFGFYGSAINNADILSKNTVEFNDPSNPTTAIAIISTPNTKVYSDLLAAYTAAGLTSTELFLDQMPGGIASGASYPLLNMGLNSATATLPSDVFGSIFRYTLPKNGVAGSNWIGSSATNVLVYRILDSSAPVANVDLYSSGATLTPSHNTNEVSGVGSSPPPTCPRIGYATTQSYICDMKELGTYLYGYLGSPSDYSAVSTGPTAAYPGTAAVNGINCITIGTSCAGGTQDTAAYDNYIIGALPYGSPAFFIGVDHATSSINNAEYTGVSAAQSSQNIGVSDILDSNPTSTFAITSATNQSGAPLSNYLYGSGSAVLGILESAGYSPSTALMADAPNLYVASFARLNSSNGCNSATAFYCVSTYPFVTLIASTTSPPSPYPYIYIRVIASVD